MGAIWLAALVGLGGYAIIGAKGVKWKLINLGIIVGLMASGMGLGLLAGMWGKNMAIGGEVAVPLAIALGAVGGLGCIRRNIMREKIAKKPGGEA